MNRFHVVLGVGIGLFACGSASAFDQNPEAAMASSSPSSVTLYAVVDVDAQGHVARVQCLQKLTPQLNSLLHTTLVKWVTKPAIRGGRQVSSRMVVTVKLNNQKQLAGDYESSFSYVSSQAVPEDRAWKVDEGKVVAIEESARRYGPIPSYSREPSDSPIVNVNR